MASVLVLAPDPNGAEALVSGFNRRGIHHEDIRLGVLNCVSLPSLDMVLAVGGNGKTQFGIQAQYLLDRCDRTELLACVGAAGRLTEQIQIGRVRGLSPISPDLPVKRCGRTFSSRLA
jgi:adenosylhomocysteine nucleosidase